MSHLALYRKYRSQTFGELVGQEHVVRTIQNGIASGKIAHSYLFTGPRGTGKTSTARLVAKALNCAAGPSPEPCNQCEHCIAITEGSCVDVLEMDAASESGVDDVRDKIVAATDYKPMVCRYKIFIIDEVHDLSAKAFDALLKTIEEPPAHIIFILATTEFNKVPPTIRSRCQKYEFHRATILDLTGRLEFVAKSEGIEYEPAALSAIARMADGGYRDALTLFEQATLTADGALSLQHVYDQLGLISEESVDEILLSIREADIKCLIEALERVYRTGRDPGAIIESLVHRLADLTRAMYGVEIGAVSDAGVEATLTAIGNRIGRDAILRYRELIAEAQKTIREVSLPKLWLEAELISLATRPADDNSNMVSQPNVSSQTQKRERNEPEISGSHPKNEPEKQTQQPIQEPSVQEPAQVDQMDDLGRAKHSWGLVVSELSAVSTVAKAKLYKTRVIKATDKSANVLFERQMDYDSVMANRKLMGAINEKWVSHVGSKMALNFTFGKPESPKEEPDAVELPAEGEPLAKMAQELFNGL